MSDVTPGQAARLTLGALLNEIFGDIEHLIGGNPGYIDRDMLDGYRADTSHLLAALAARQPQPAPGCPDPSQHRDVYGRPLPDTMPQPVPGDAPEIRITDCSAHHDALHIQINTGHNWLCAVALSATLAEYEPQPAGDVKPAPELAAAIQDIIDRYPEREPAPELAGSVVRVISTAPELREAMAETRHLRADLRTLADLWDASSNRDEEIAARPNRARLVLEERATTRRNCAADIRKLAGPEGK